MKKTVKLLSLMLAVLFVFAMVGCNPEQNNNQETKNTDKPAEGDNTVKPVILAVSFGTSYNDSREKTIGAIEDALKTAYPDYEVRRAFTSQIIIDKLKERDNLTIDNVTEALDRLVADGVKEVVIQPTHVMSGYEYDDVINEVNKYTDKFDSVKISKNLLAADSDYDAFVEILVNTTADYNAEGTAIVYMGHGTEHEANATYAKLQEKMTAAGHNNYFIGTVEATPSVEDVIALVKGGGYKKVVLLPLMIVAGDHANNDMAGDEEDSWKTLFKNEGFEVECVIRGLGELADVQQLIVKHCGEAMGK